MTLEVIEIPYGKSTLPEKPTLPENEEKIKACIRDLNAQVAYYLSIAQEKVYDIDELERALYDLREAKHA